MLPVYWCWPSQTQLEHILLRPDTYIGSVEAETETRWLYDADAGGLTLRRGAFVPGLLKIFDEILVNAADNRQREGSGMTSLDVRLDQASGCITVRNDGRGIPVELHREHGVFVPELVFGHLLTSSNYDDASKRTVGGRNGFGAKLANIFSLSFSVCTHDSRQGKTFSQRWTANMSRKQEPAILNKKGGADFTEVAFVPDYARFGCSGLSADMLQLMTRRVWDVAATSGAGLRVSVNGRHCSCPSFAAYAAMFCAAQQRLSPSPSPAASSSLSGGYVHERFGPRWELCVAASDGRFSQLSWVNSCCTSRGGSHVAHVTELLVRALTAAIERKHKKLKLKPAHVKSQLSLYLNCLVDNPAFDTQTKECLTSKRASWGGACELSEGFVKALLSRTALVAAIVSFSTFKQSAELSRTDGKRSGRISGLPKLDDANDAGTRNGRLCTLILTEGDSAKALAVAGLSVIGRDRYGVFPLRGKLLNVREASTKQVADNAEVCALKRILGLQQGRVYSSTDSLRYGHVMIMTDQDHDGSHIKGLILNLFAVFWPSLLQLPGFLSEFITPIVKVRQLRSRQETAFYTLPEFAAWRSSRPEHASRAAYAVKYYKGLGTSSAAEAKEYFTAIARHRLEFVCDGGGLSSLELAFGKTQADARKDWLQQWRPELFLDQSRGRLSLSEFVHQELILFSVASNQRAIPSLVDGLKPGQRKILHACFLKRLSREMKVAQLAGFVAERTAYHHGEQALTATIVAMAQGFVGSNNLSLLQPSGMFGTRLQGGKDQASARYIFTSLSPIARAVFPQLDDGCLRYLSEDGQDIEPEFFLPVLPLVLVNGSSGIGTGWSSSVPCFNPRELVANLRLLLRGEEMRPMAPWYRGFTGSMLSAGGGRWQHSGVLEALPDGRLLVSELPIGVWTAEYKALLEAMLEAGELGGYREYHTDTSVRFLLTLDAELQREWGAQPGGLHRRLRLVGSLSTSNMVLFDDGGRLRRFDSALDIIAAFFPLRLAGYRRRREQLIAAAQLQLVRLSNQRRFILAVVSEQVRIRGVRRQALLQTLHSQGYAAMPRQQRGGGGRAASAAAAEADDEGEGEGEEEQEDAADGEGLVGFDYLLSLPLFSLTAEKVERLQRATAAQEAALAALTATSAEEMWTRDLDAFLLKLDEYEQDEGRREQQAAAAAQRAAGKSGKTLKDKDRAAAAPRGSPLPPPPPLPEKETKDKKAGGRSRKEKEAVQPAPEQEAEEAEQRDAEAKEPPPKPRTAAVVRKKASAVTAGRPRALRRQSVSDGCEDEDEDDCGLFASTAPPPRLARAAVAVQKAGSKEAEDSEDDEDDGEAEYCAEPQQDDDDDDDEDTGGRALPARARAKGKAKAAAAASSLSLSERLALRLDGVSLGAATGAGGGGKRSLTQGKAGAGETPEAKRVRGRGRAAAGGAPSVGAVATAARARRAAASRATSYREPDSGSEPSEAEPDQPSSQGSDSDYAD